MTNRPDALSYFHYRTGELVKSGDKLLWHGEPAAVEYVVDPGCSDEAHLWHLTHSPSGGIMIHWRDTEAVFETGTEYLEFLQRGD